MTKFEEELFNKVPCKFELTTEAEYKKTTLINHFKNWHSDEEFKAEIKKLTDQLITRNDELISSNYEIESLKSQLISREKQVIEMKEADKAQGKEIIQLKSQLQQQALPVVPECVAEFIEDCKKEGDCLFGVFADATRVEHDMPDLVYFWLGDEGNNDELFARAWLDGYTVEKPQLFYLKNKLTGKYLRKSKHTKDDWNEDIDRVETVNNKTKFTQSEIDSMQTGSYEQIEVEK